MKREIIFGILGLLAVVAYFIFYIGGRRYLYENFQPVTGEGTGPGPSISPPGGQPAVTVAKSTSPTAINSGQPKQIDLAPVDVPFTTKPINDVDDYEYNLVYQNESDKAVSKALISKLMSQRPMEWSGMPPSSSQFQAGLRESFENATPTVPDDAKPYDNIAGNLMQPPDMSEAEKEEKKILQTYRPKFPPTPTSYDSRDVNELIKKVYDAKGVVPDVRHKDGTNVYEIVGVRRKDEKVVFEDEAVEAEATEGPNKGAMESTVKAPLAVRDMNSRSQDSFFDEGSAAVEKKSRANRWDYTAWTPGLERMFAPTKPQQQWY
jgi:hypothetical protein